VDARAGTSLLRAPARLQVIPMDVRAAAAMLALVALTG
jgi:hypothetical protein